MINLNSMTNSSKICSVNANKKKLNVIYDMKRGVV
jgi:hypothetical protein